MSDKPIDEAEARQILEDLARNGPPTAKVGAIKVLREMAKDARAAEEAEREADAIPPGFEGLYDDEFSRRMAKKYAERLASEKRPKGSAA
jgi:hypothetical protein